MRLITKETFGILNHVKLLLTCHRLRHMSKIIPCGRDKSNTHSQPKQLIAMNWAQVSSGITISNLRTSLRNEVRAIGNIMLAMTPNTVPQIAWKDVSAQNALNDSL